MILLDTNVLSELMKASPDSRVRTWTSREPSERMFISTISEAELLYGVAILPAGRRRNQLSEAITATLRDEFAGRLLPFDSAAAVAFAGIAAARRRAGRPISQFDGQIAAIAKSRGASLATRNTKDFDGCGIDRINPWDER